MSYTGSHELRGENFGDWPDFHNGAHMHADGMFAIRTSVYLLLLLLLLFLLLLLLSL